MKTHHTKTIDSSSTLYVGIDISKNKLDVAYELKKPFVIPFTLKAITRLTEQLNQTNRPYQLIFEATGWLSERLCETCRDLHVPYTCVNPARARAFARSGGFMAKTDRVDAMMLALMGQEKQLEAHIPHDATIVRLRELLRLRRFLTEQAGRIKITKHAYSHKQDHQRLDDILRSLEQQQSQSDKQIMHIIQQTPKLDARYRFYLSQPGIGPQTAMGLTVFFPELGSIGRKKVAALLGVAPISRESGDKIGRRYIYGGRKELRNTFYMCSLQLVRRNPVLKEQYTRLISKGKPTKVALIACLHKMIIYLNAQVRILEEQHILICPEA